MIFSDYRPERGECLAQYAPEVRAFAIDELARRYYHCPETIHEYLRELGLDIQSECESYDQARRSPIAKAVVADPFLTIKEMSEQFRCTRGEIKRCLEQAGIDVESLRQSAVTGALQADPFLSLSVLGKRFGRCSHIIGNYVREAGLDSMSLRREARKQLREQLRERKQARIRRPNLRELHRREHRSWESMLDRCLNPKSVGYRYYGGRGIKVCDRWNRKAGGSFLNFYRDMGPRPVGMTLDRINNDGNYNAQNCRWATRKQQVENRRPRAAVLFPAHPALAPAMEAA
jgi:hypothetical protein